MNTVSGAQGDIILTPGGTLPLTLDDDIWQVPLASPAYRHLPPQSVLSSSDALKDIIFPEEDLAGNEIDYTCKTHSGAWQQVYLAPGESEPAPECDGTPATDIQISPPSGTIYTERTYAITAAVTPSDASQAVTWASSDPDVATIESNGSNTGKITPLSAGTATITATSAGTPAVTASVEITVVAYPHVAAITLEADTIRSAHHLTHRIYPPVITPADALDKAFDWTLDDPQGIVAHTVMGGVCTLQGKQAGTAKLIVTAADGGVADTCVLVFTDPHYTDGVFMLTEGNYPGHGYLNFLHPDGTWDYHLYTSFNNPTDFQTPQRTFGITSQYGAIYGDKFYVVSKQGPRLVVFDPVTIEQHREFWNFPSGDGRAFLGVDEHTGYISSSSGIHVVDLDDMSSATGGYKSSGKAVETLPATTVEGTQSGSGLYTGQTGTMIRVGERVFAVSQNNGIMVINARTHTVEKFLDTYHYAVLAQSYDGYLWAAATVTEASGNLGDPSGDSGQGGMMDDAVTYNALIRIDPWTLEEKPFPLPNGVGAPPSTWAAWQADPLVGSPKENALYWLDRTPANNGLQLIRRYDIATGEVTTVFDASDNAACPLPAEFPSARWNMYGPSFRIHPVSGDLYVWITLFHLMAPNPERLVWEVYRINPVTGEQLGHYPLDRRYWWPSLFIFPDNADPEIDASFPPSVTLGASHRQDTLALRPLVSDADQMPASIVKTVEEIGDPALVEAFIRHDSLFIRPLKDVAAEQGTSVTLKFNSNGKALSRTLDVKVQPGAIAHPVTGVTLGRRAAELAVGGTLALTATVAPADAGNRAVAWTSSQPLIASVDNNGTVTAHLAPGTADIIVTTLEGGFTDTCTVTTLAPGGVEENPFELTQQAIALYPNQTVQLALTAPQHFTVAWRSSSPSVAAVTQAGLVTTLAAGTAYIIAADFDKNRADTCLVTVSNLPSQPQYTLVLNTSALTLVQGERSALSVAVTPQQAGQSPQWSSSNPSVADVTSAGTVIAVSPGTAQIRATLGTVSAACAVTVTSPSTQLVVSAVTQDAARIDFPRNEEASYYLVHIYELKSGGVKPFLTLKVTPDGRVTLRALAGNNLVVPLSYLSPGTSYAVHLETVRERDGRAEVIRTEAASFTTQGTPTGLSAPEAGTPRVYCTGGILRLENLDGYDCILMAVSGRTIERFRVSGTAVQRPVNLPAGIYILTATDGRQNPVFKFTVH